MSITIQRCTRGASALAALSLVLPASAQISVQNQTAPLTVVEDFSSFASGEVPGILVVPGARIAEDCFGQTTTEQGSGFELTTGFPSNPPTLRTPPAHDGVYVHVFTALSNVSGMAQGDTIDDIGEGALTIVYDLPQQQLGLRITGSNGSGNATFRAFASDGTLIGQAIVASSPDRDLTISSGGAPIRALTFTNTDPLGLALDDLRHIVPAGPSAYCFGDGSAFPCPCGNAGATGNGCANGSFAAGARLDFVPGPSLAVIQGVPNQPILFFRGTQVVNGGVGVGFGDGLRCAGGSVVRLGVRILDSSGAASFLNLPTPPPGTSYYQGWYRDPTGSPCGSKFNLTNGLRVTWLP